MSNFFITGLPRSRTAWLANLFTYGDVFCYHDLSVKGDVKKIMDANPAKVVGNSDSGIGFCSLDEFDDPKILVVNRNPQNVVKSMKAVLPFPEKAEAIVAALAESLKRFDGARKVDYEDLSDLSVLADLWGWLTGGQPFNEERAAMLIGMNVTIDIDTFLGHKCVT